MAGVKEVIEVKEEIEVIEGRGEEGEIVTKKTIVRAKEEGREDSVVIEEEVEMEEEEIEIITMTIDMMNKGKDQEEIEIEEKEERGKK